MNDDLISRQAAIEALFDWEMTYDWDDHCREEDPKPEYIVSPSDVIKKLPSAQPEIVRCKDCKYWHSGSCEYPEHVVNSQDYYVGDIETEAEHFCGYAERR